MAVTDTERDRVTDAQFNAQKEQLIAIFQKVDYLEKRLDGLTALVEKIAISMGINPYG